MRIVAFLLFFLVSCLVLAEKVNIEAIQKALQCLNEERSEEPYYLIDNPEVYEYYSKTLGRKKENK